jgi:class 3 adenylate cyclase
MEPTKATGKREHQQGRSTWLCDPLARAGLAAQNDCAGMGTRLSEEKRRRLAGRPPMDALASVNLPVGTLTFFMTDIEGSTKLWDGSRSSAKRALERHDRIVLEQVERNQGQLVESGREGDSVLAVFRQASDAVACALDAQRSLQREDWPAGVEIWSTTPRVAPCAAWQASIRHPWSGRLSSI